MIRICTYNVHSCIGVDGVVSPTRIAEVVAETGADVVALQELDVGRRRTGGTDQAAAIALALGMDVHFHPAVRLVEEAYGDAVLATLPTRLVKAAALPGASPRRRFQEPRGALWVEVEADGGRLQVINTHLGLLPGDQACQVEALLGAAWLDHPACTDPVLLVGDFNAPTRTRTYRRLAGTLADTQRAGGGRPTPTFPGRFPLMCLDHAFLRGGLRVAGTRVVDTPLARLASDHLPLVIDVEFP